VGFENPGGALRVEVFDKAGGKDNVGPAPCARDFLLKKVDLQGPRGDSPRCCTPLEEAQAVGIGIGDRIHADRKGTGDAIEKRAVSAAEFEEGERAGC